MTYSKILLVLVGLMSFPVGVFAQPLASLKSGNTLLPACKQLIAAYDKAGSSLYSPQSVVCLAYVTGYLHGADATLITAAAKAYGDTSPTWKADLKKLAAYCLPDGVAVIQVVRVIVQYLEKHPTELHQDPEFLVYGALITGFPCK
jgi:Rap1a immunity proteins